MKRTIASLVLAVLAAASNPAWSGDKSITRRPAAGQAVIGARASLAYREITLFLRDGTVVLGRLLGADSGSIRVLRDGPDLEVPFRDIKKVVIKEEGRSSSGFLPGVVAGLYSGTGLLFGAFGNSGNYMPKGGFHDEYEMIGLMYVGLLETVFAAAGGGLGWLATSGARQRAFEFPGDPDGFGAAREGFLRYLGGESPPAHVHLIVQGGYVSPRVTRGFEEAVDEAGIVYDRTRSDDSRFSLLRGLELSYSLEPRLRPGLRLSFTGEPEYYVYPSSGPYSWARLAQSYRATCLHAVCSYEALRRRPSAKMSWSVGLGVGAASVRLSRASAYWNGTDYVDEQAWVERTLVSGVAFTSLQFRLNDILTAGIAADYTFIPAATVAGLPSLGLPALRVGLGNASIGFVLGYHF